LQFSFENKRFHNFLPYQYDVTLVTQNYQLT
jgi:hypothetical protein